MMKKVLALVMVLSMVGFASAALQLDVAGGKVTVMGKLDVDQFLILSAGNGATLSNFALGAAAPAASYMAASAADFAGLAPVPADFAGEGWFLGVFPGEAFKEGAQLMADVALTSSQGQGNWLRDETVTEGCDPGKWKIRSIYELIETSIGSLSLTFLSSDYAQGGNIQALDVRNQVVIGETFVDGPCVPEPLTLSLLGLGALVLRRRS